MQCGLVKELHDGNAKGLGNFHDHHHARILGDARDGSRARPVYLTSMGEFYLRDALRLSE